MKLTKGGYGEPSGGLKFMFLAAATVIVIAGLKAAASIFVPVLLAFFIATVSFPITNWLREHRVPRWLAVLLTVLVDFAFLAGVVVIAVILVGDFSEKWAGTGPADPSSYKSLVEKKIGDVSLFIVEQLEKREFENARETVDSYFRSKALDQLEQIDFGQVWSLGTGVVGRVASFFGTTFFVLLMTIFMLTEARMYGRRISAICEAKGPDFERIFSATRDIQRFLGIKTVVSLVTGLLAGLLCWIADLDFFILWGILAYALNYVPVIGSVIAGVPPTVLALIVSGGPQALAVATGYTAINVFIGNFIEPMLMGSRFGLSTLMVILSVMFWGWLWGPVGMLLAVPLTMLMKVAMLNSEDFRWLAVAMSKEDRVNMKARVEELRTAVQEADGSSVRETATES
ncbi:AI-2E family transporter [Roseibacillus ishigakijimensis]|uniref:AI-2E family transporter n=1 Tax=Roseibacillus ishigakijimensis TaxID=454146 RepID=A0A934RRT9_9BACT|nr:AI-2E family transporter [Roseibacillus ishigakijimensis]MBK1834476.1 AI-2E family transporter [Roseibacillus ishigakijimensis]